MKLINKPWGKEEILETNENYTVKRLTMNNGNQCSYQYHKKKLETILVLEGELTIILEGKEKSYFPGQTITIQPLQQHRMAARKGKVLYLECSTSELEDVVRIKDDYNREVKAK